MKFFPLKDSLLKATIKRLKTNEKLLKLYSDNKKFRLRNFFVSKRSWIAIIPGTLITFVLFSLVSWLFKELYYFHFFYFIKLKYETAVSLLDGRLANIATIMSINFAVVGFLFSNLASKNKESYQIMASETKLYPIIYFGLSLVASLTLLSLFRDTMSPHLFISAVTLGIYLILAMLFFIGFLFKNLLQFTNPDHMNDLFKKNFLANIRVVGEENIIKDISQEIYCEELEKIGLPLVNFYSKSENLKSVILKSDGQGIIKDIKISAIIKFLKNVKDLNPEKSCYYSIGVLSSFSRNLELFELNIELGPEDNKKFCSFYKIKNRTESQLNFSEHQEVLFEKFEKATNENDIKQLTFSLNLFKELYENSFRYFDSEKDTKIVENFLILNIEHQIYKNLEFAIQKDKDLIIKDLVQFVFEVLFISLNKNSIIGINRYKFFPMYFYNFYHEKKAYKEVLFEQVSKNLNYLVRTAQNIALEQKNVSSNENTSLLYLTYLIFSNYLVQILLKGEIEDFISSFKDFQKTDLNQGSNFVNKSRNESLKNNEIIVNKIETYNKHINFAYYSWLLYLFKENTLSIDNVIRLISLFENLDLKIEEILGLYLFIDNEENIFGFDYFEFSRWDYKDRSNFIRAYSVPQPHDWLRLGFFIYLVNHINRLENIDIDKIPNSSNYSFMLRQLKEEYKSILQNFETWKRIIFPGIYEKNNDENLKKHFEINSDKIFSFLALLSGRYEAKIKSDIAEQKFSEGLINEFKEDLSKTWRENNNLGKLFSHFGNKKGVNDPKGLYHFGFQTFFKGAKMMFVEKHHSHIYNSNELAWDVTRIAENHFYQKIFKDKQFLKYKNLEDSLKELIKTIKERKFEPNLIILSSKFHYSSEFFKKDTKFINKYELNESQKELFEGTYDGIPFIIAYNEQMEEKIIVSCFEKAFEMVVYEDKKFIDEQFFIDIREIKDSEIRNIFESEKDSWLKDEFGNILTEENALNYIKNSIFIELWVKGDFIIKNPDAYEIAKIEDTE
jgi:hypothetical protein